MQFSWIILIWVVLMIIGTVFNAVKKAQLLKVNKTTDTHYSQSQNSRNIHAERDYDNNALEYLKDILEKTETADSKIKDANKYFTEKSPSMIKDNIEAKSTASIKNQIDNARLSIKNSNEQYRSSINNIKSIDEEENIKEVKQSYSVLLNEDMMKQVIVYDAILNPKRINYSRVRKS